MNFNKNRLVITREYEWRVNKSLLNFDYNNNYLMSEVFEIFLDQIKTKWQVVLTNHHNIIHAYLHKIEPSTINEFTVNFWVFSDDPIKSMFAKQILANRVYTDFFIDGDWFFVQKHDYLSDIFTLKFKITLEEMPFDSYYPVEIRKLLSKYEEMLNSDSSYNDFTFICSDGISIAANHSILSITSPVLRTMLNVPMTESKDRVANVEDIDSKTMKEMIRFMYAGKVKNINECAPKLIYCAEKYQLEELKKLCVRSMIRNASADNVFEYLTIADRYQEKNLFKRCLLIITYYYELLCEQPEWKTLDAKMIDTIEYFLQNKEKPMTLSLKTSHQGKIKKLPKGYKEFP